MPFATHTEHAYTFNIRTYTSYKLNVSSIFLLSLRVCVCVSVVCVCMSVCVCVGLLYNLLSFLFVLA